MHPYAIVSLFNAIAVLSLGLFVYSKNSKARVNTDWLLLSVAAAGWCFGTFLLNISKTPNSALFCVRLLNYFAMFIGPLFIQFCYSIAHKIFPKSHQVVLFGVSVLFVFFASCFPHLYISSVNPGIYFYFVPQVHWLYHLYSVFFLSCVTYSLVFLYCEFKSAKGRKQTQFKYLFFSMLIAFTGGASTLLICYGIEFPYGNFYFSLYAFIMSYAILAHSLMDIEVIIKRTIVFAGLFLTAMTTVSVISALMNNLLGKYFLIPHYWVAVSSALVVMLFFDSVRRILADTTDHYLFQKKFDYRKLLKEASREMASIKSLEKLARIVVGFLIVKARIKNVSAFVYSFADNAYILQASRPYLRSNWNMVLAEDHPLVQELKKLQGPIEREVLKCQIEESVDPESKNQIIRSYDVLQKLKAEVVIPSFLYLETHQKHNHSGPVLRSILFLGPKKSDEMYTPEDLDIFYVLARESAMAIENARLYDENIKRERNKVLGDMTGSVAHEMRHPIAYIQYNIHFMKKALLDVTSQVQNLAIPDEQREKIQASLMNMGRYSQPIESAADRVNGIVQTLEDYAKMKTANGKINNLDPVNKASFKQVDFKTLMDLTLAELRFRYRVNNQFVNEIKTEVSNPPPLLFGDQNRLIQILMNLIANAHDALENSKIKQITVKAYPDPNDPKFIHIEVKDTGCGISEDAVRKIFEEGFTTKAGKGGSGSGLSWCRNLVVTVHGGAITVESTVGVGTTFHVKIPQWDSTLKENKSDAGQF